MRREDLLRPGRQGTLSWSVRNEQTGWIRYRCHEDRLELIYRARPAGGEWLDVDESVALVSVAQPFGGVRQYFRCPGCQKRCLVLYGGVYFRCRSCANLSYASQNEDATDRACSKARAIRRRLGCEGNFEDPFPRKPKGMHWKTYRRLEQECEVYENQVSMVLANMLMKFG